MLIRGVWLTNGRARIQTWADEIYIPSMNISRQLVTKTELEPRSLGYKLKSDFNVEKMCMGQEGVEENFRRGLRRKIQNDCVCKEVGPCQETRTF